MKYHYSARTKAGELQVGYVEAVNRNAAFNILNSHDLYILSIEEVNSPKLFTAITGFFNRVKRQDLMVFTRQFATLLEAKIPMTDSLKNLYAQTKNIYLKEVIYEVSQDIGGGLSLSQALERHTNIFSEFYVNLIRSAEVTGRVEEVMGFLADFLEKELSLIGRVRNALIYPVFVVGLFIIVAGVLVGFVFPQLAPIFEESNVPLPVITKMLLATGKFVASWWVVIVVALIAVTILLIDYFKSEEGKAVFNQIGFKIPIVGNLLKKVFIARFSESISVLIKGGIPIAEAIEISGGAVGSPVYAEALRASADQIRAGELLSVALSRDLSYFPPMVGQMVSVGEKTGKLEEMFDRIARMYSREIDSVVNNLVELIQPILMVVMGALVGLLFASILIPIYNLAQAF